MLPLKKSELVNIIQDLIPFQNPKIDLEQYPTDPVATVDFFYYIAFEQRELVNHVMIDFGCGSGNLSIAGALFGAKHVLAIDIDPDALRVCEQNISTLNLHDKISLLNLDLTEDEARIKILQYLNDLHFQNKKILGVSNPPFGVQHRGIDVKFISLALACVDVLYSIHLQSDKNRYYLERKIPQLGGEVTNLASLQMMIQNTYQHHRKKHKKIQTDVYRIIPKKRLKE